MFQFLPVINRKYTVHDVLCMPEFENYKQADILTPPEGNVTDEYSADGDAGGLVDDFD